MSGSISGAGVSVGGSSGGGGGGAVTAEDVLTIIEENPADVRAAIGADKEKLGFSHKGTVADNDILDVIPLVEAINFPAGLTGAIGVASASVTCELTVRYRATPDSGSTTTCAVLTWTATNEATLSGGSAVTGLATGQLEFVITDPGTLDDTIRLWVNVIGTKA